MNIKDILKYNSEQIGHERLVMSQVLQFCNKLLQSALYHDLSKWSDKEYEAFVNSQESLKQSKDGKDEEYQKHLNSEAIQHHIKNNEHHAEYWDNLKETMPLDQAIIMYFDWKSRSLQKGSSMDDFWEYNMEKLKKQPLAKAVVELMKEKEDEKETKEMLEVLKNLVI